MAGVGPPAGRKKSEQTNGDVLDSKTLKQSSSNGSRTLTDFLSFFPYPFPFFLMFWLPAGIITYKEKRLLTTNLVVSWAPTTESAAGRTYGRGGQRRKTGPGKRERAQCRENGRGGSSGAKKEKKYFSL